MCEEKVVIFISCDIASYHLLRVYDSPTPLVFVVQVTRRRRCRVWRFIGCDGGRT